ncbi:MAG: hypothetical protein IKB62_01090 [Oscillospiraceae bacterium]|nr:hypothetical protein [Oscillospiraceae bacterium]
MVFFMGFAAGLAVGICWYRYLYLERYENSEIVCNEKETDKELYKQYERLIAYGNDSGVKR